MNHIILFILLGYMSLVLQNAIMLKVVDIQYAIKQLLVAILIIYIPHTLIFTFLISTHIFSFTSMIVWMILSFLVYVIFFKAPWVKSAFIAAGVFFLAASMDYVLSFILNQFPGDMACFLRDNLYIPRTFATLLYAWMFVFIKKFANKGYSSLDYLIAKHWRYYLAFFISFLIYDLIHITGLLYVNAVADVIAVILFVAFFIHSLWHVRLNHQLELTQRQLETEQLYIASQENTLDDLRGFRHDLSNILNSINGMIQNKKYEDLEIYVGEATAQIDAVQTPEIADSIKRIPVLSGILLEKIARAEMKGIKFTITIMGDEIALRYCAALDYSRMIGILLDNAFEAAEETSSKSVELIVRDEDGKLINTIINTCDKPVDIDRIFEHGYSTKLEPSGEGLPQLRLIQERYRRRGHTIEVIPICKDGLFTQTLVI